MLYIRDLTGQRFGRIVVLEQTPQRKGGSVVWKCRCDCGNILFLASRKLTENNIYLCECIKKDRPKKSNFNDLSGKKFSRLLVLRRSKYKPGGTSGKATNWLCKCDCGKYKIVARSALIRGGTKSCGCWIKEVVSNRNTTHGLTHTKEYKRARNRKHKELKKQYDSEYGVELEAALKEFFSSCVICGVSREEHVEKYGKDLQNDHVLPLSKGHGLKPGNAVVLCAHHNESKNDRSLNNLPVDWQDKILKATKEFEEYWYAKAGEAPYVPSSQYEYQED